MQVGETNLKELIEGEKQFIVPLYQRPYSWETPQLRQLWADILDQYEILCSEVVGGKMAVDAPPHFLGSMVLAPSPLMQAHGVTPFVLVDGQQRLTTLLIAMCALRDHAAIADPNAVDRYNKRYLINEFGKGDSYYRLLPSYSDRKPFFACVSRTSDRGGQDRIGSAYNFFHTQLALEAGDGKGLDSEKLEMVLRTRLRFVAITTAPADNVHRIFESLNDRGVRLTQADLLRNYLFMLLPTRGDKLYWEVWRPMQDSLTPTQLEDLVYVDLVLRGNPTARRREIYRAQQDRLRKFEGNEAAVEGELLELARRARHFSRLVDPSTEQHPGIKNALLRLDAWGSTTTYPLIMHLYTLLESGQGTATEMQEALHLVESYLARRLMVNVPTNNLNRIFNSIVAQLPKHLPIVDAVRQELSSERKFWPSDERLRSAFRSEPFYYYGRHEHKLLILRWLEESYDHAEPVNFDTVKLSIEHIMPQTLTSEWKEALSAEGDDPEEVHSQLLHTIGNLTLTAYNGKLTNSPFERKRQILEDSHLELNRAIAQAVRWDRKAILARADELAERAIAVWPSPLGGQSEPSGERDWSRLHAALAGLPAGCWTTYKDLAELIGSHQVPVGQHLANTPDILNAHRVLASTGRVAENFHWSDPADTRPIHDVLQAEGVHFNEKREADPKQRRGASDLAALLAEYMEPDGQGGLPAQGTLGLT